MGEKLVGQKDFDRTLVLEGKIEMFQGQIEGHRRTISWLTGAEPNRAKIHLMRGITVKGSNAAL
jgi:hypothetical protein